MADQPQPQSVDEPDGAWAHLRDALARSDPAHEGGPAFYVPDETRRALRTAFTDHDDLLQDAEERGERWAALLRRARTACAGPVYAKLRADIDQALKDPLS